MLMRKEPRGGSLSHMEKTGTMESLDLVTPRRMSFSSDKEGIFCFLCSYF